MNESTDKSPIPRERNPKCKKKQAKFKKAPGAPRYVFTLILKLNYNFLENQAQPPMKAIQISLYFLFYREAQRYQKQSWKRGK
jgi:hypothetical protein